MGTALKDLLTALRKTQEERAQTYSSFESLFKDCLKTKHFCSYKSGVGACTTKFAEISKKVLEIEAEVGKNGFKDAAVLIRQLQLNEKEKLGKTASLHVKKIEHVVTEGRDELELVNNHEVRTLNMELQAIVIRINEILEELRSIEEDELY
eukprot:TRINITY_DN129_c0_g2_i2.p1 TRINITY_DN129_c0_g2~~TRINITY_DN129_c0_g2_i2.p1  ORF type:complete len:151 (-),score=4.83 TRINITY_DN129_c0_g2_i2:127-579(-)